MDFVCGVLEGFYGTPWRVSERKELFERLKNLQLNTYMYAPKDDLKHRVLWREKYTSCEKEVLKVLVNEAKTQGIEFVYSISPGLDIVFSSPADITALKEKLEQVYLLGCKSFALLFDDIDPELCLADKSEFSTFGAAQVYVSNKLYEWFEELKLVLFCPTEYCITRAKPDVENSEYLQCLGKYLNINIRVMWTGPKVVSQIIDTHSIDILARVLKRKPVIWDNIHANDYDQRRVFLGPFKGRPMDLYEHTSGILTNPNCEFECNFIAIHSLSTWLRVAKLFSEENKLEDISNEEENNSSSSSYCSSSGSSSNENVSLLYDSNLALYDAVDCWMELFSLPRDTIQGSKLHVNKVSWDKNINSLLSEEVLEDTEADKNESKDINIDEKIMENGISDENVLEESKEPSDFASPEKKARQSTITSEDVLLLCDLFHLPYEHGERGLKLLSDFRWLKENAINYQQAITKEKVETWVENSKQFHMKCQLVEDMYTRFLEICNKRIVEQLFPYVYDVKETVIHLSKFVKCLGSMNRLDGYKFLPTDPEAWFYRGGIAAEIERLLPTPEAKLLENVSTGNQSQLVHVIRPYLEEDKESLYQMCRNLSAVPEAYTNYPDLPGDSLIGAYLKYSPENVFVIKVDDHVCGVIAAHTNGKHFYEKVKKEWLPGVCKQYKKPGGDPDVWSHEEHMINRLYYPQFFTPVELFDKYEAVITMRLMPNVQNVAVCLQVMKCIQAVVKKNMCCQLKTSLNATYKILLTDIGFSEITFLKDKPNDIILYGLQVK